MLNMAASIMKYLLILFTAACATSDEIELQLTSGTIQKFLRAMSNETQGADTLNLPANASSIRENITDTFSCENRTYGYYADVDNECQVFHVCLPSQTPNGRNVTYRWSFICPSETIFNQEVLVCTRPIDSIPCEDSPMYYDLNMEIGKVPNNTKEYNTNIQTNEPAKEKVRRTQNRKPVRKQNIVQDLLEKVVDEEMKEIEEMEIDNGMIDVEGTEEIVPVLVDPSDNEPKFEEFDDELGVDDKIEGRLVEERSMPWAGRKLQRGMFRFKADV